MKKCRLRIDRIIPFIGLVGLVAIFTILAGDKFWRPNNLLSIFNQTVLFMIGGLGMVFVIAQGSTDLLQGSALALIATISAIMANRFGLWAIVPSVLVLGTLVGLINGLIVS